MPPADPIEIRPLTPDLWDGLATLFAEGGDPRWCWCMYWRVRARDFASSTVAANREALHALAAAQPPPGIVALAGGRVVGWCAVAPRVEYERLALSRTIPRTDDRPVWSVVCFVVSRSARGQGIARELLRGAIDHATLNGAPALEAYPADLAGIGRIAASAAYGGTLSLFEEAGFRVVGPTSAVTGGAPRVVVRRDLDPPGSPSV